MSWWATTLTLLLVLLVLATFVGYYYYTHHSPPQPPPPPPPQPAEKMLVGAYFPNWAQYRIKSEGLRSTDEYKYTASDVGGILPAIDILFYAFAKFEFQDDGRVVVLGTEWNDVQSWSTILAARAASSATTKLVLSVGGWNFGGAPWQKLVASDVAIASFASSAAALVADHQLDGIDLDWEQPAPTANDVGGLVKLVGALRSALAATAAGTKKLITMAVPVTLAKTLGDLTRRQESLYPLTRAQESLCSLTPLVRAGVDYFNVMAYDIHGPWEGVVGPNAPLTNPSPLPTGWQLQDTLQSAVGDFVAAGVPRSQLLLGMAAYGHSFVVDQDTLATANDVWTWKSLGAGPKGQCLYVDGSLAYNEIVCDVATNGASIVDDVTQSQITLYKQDSQNVVVVYDTPQTVAAKVSYAASQNVGGVFLWDVSDDLWNSDWLQAANGIHRYPMIHACCSKSL